MSKQIEYTIEDGDYIISSNGFEDTLRVYNGRVLADVTEWTESDIVHFIRDKMDKENYWPNVWYVSDHGNINLLRLYKHCYRFA